MYYQNRISTLVVLLGAITLVTGCGGGGGSGVVMDPIFYDGNTDRTVITTTNTARLVANVTGSTATTDTITASRVTGSTPSKRIDQGRLSSRLSRFLRDTLTQIVAGRSAELRPTTGVVIDEIELCESGSIHYTGTINNDGTGIVTATYNNCRFGDETLNGQATLNVVAFELSFDIITDSTFSFSTLTLTTPTLSVSISGSIRSQVTIGTNTDRLTVNMVTRNDTTGDMTKAENLVIVDVYDNFLFSSSFSETLTGRVFDSVHGFVDVSTPIPLIFSTTNQLFPDSGQLLLTGAGEASIRITVLSETMVMLELDLDGDSTHEIVATLRWVELADEVSSDLADTDGDGLHDSWETFYGLNFVDENDATLDLDGDWLTNIVEYQEGSIPNDALSYPLNADIYDLDSTFGIAGVVLYEDPLTQSDEEGRAVAIQSDGKILVTGFIFNVDRINTLVLRYNNDGTLDSTFGTSGVVVYSECGGCGGEGYAIAIQADGKIIVAGYTRSGVYDNGSILLLRLNGDGTFDDTFGTNGRVVTNISNYGDWGYDLAIQQDGKIVVTGVTSTGTDTYALVLRYNSDGTLDNTFGTAGISTYDGVGSDEAKGVAIQLDGKIVIAGSTSDATITAYTDVLTLRYNADGTLDTGFGINGIVTYDNNNNFESASTVTIQADGGILIAGATGLLRYASNGALDANFGTDGVVGYPAQSLVLKPDGKIITVAGGSVRRYNPDGSLDTTFSREGYGFYSVGDPIGQIYGVGVALQTDGKIVVTGRSAFHDSFSDNAVFTLRLHAH